MDTNTILGILSGSLGTILLTKIFDIFSEKRIFKRELKRQFFAKKLEAAEKATKFYISSRDSYGMFQTALGLFIKDGDASCSFALLQEAATKCKSLWNISIDHVNMISLYFDEPKPNNWYPADNEAKIANLISEFIGMDFEAGELNQNLEKATINKQTDLAEALEKNNAMLKKEAKRIAEELIKCIDYEKRKITHFTKTIHDELKKHDI